MGEHNRSPSPSRSSLPPPLHRHLRSAPQSSRSMPTITTHTPALWSGGQRSTTDPAFYTYPPPLNTSRDPSLPSPENQQAETTHGWQIDVPQPNVPFWDERFPHPQRLGHAESYTRADDSGWEGNYSSTRRAHTPDWRQAPTGQFEEYSRFSLSPEILRSQRTLGEPSSSRISFTPYVAVPEGLSTRAYERPDLNASGTTEPTHDQAYLQSASSALPNADDFVSPLLDSVLLDLPRLPTTADGSSPEAGQEDPVEESSMKTGRKGKQRATVHWKKVRLHYEGRKLGCSGDRPKCKTCIKRGGECAYEATARRRGPGKAKRGSRKLAKGRGTDARTQQSTPDDGMPTFPGVTFEVPLPPIQTPGGDNFDPPPANGEESKDHRWRANSVDRAFLTSLSLPGWGTVT
ncbi:hypothetical protein BC826DRAFT_966767 [Russula brevipes]|nr:hypothetical protein BC826DRAFT_966767 [Russula brevipes]